MMLKPCFSAPLRMLQPDLDVELVEVELRMHEVMGVVVVELELLVLVRYLLEDLSVLEFPTFGAMRRYFGNAFSRACFGHGPS